jgi:hypothetical protein
MHRGAPTCPRDALLTDSRFVALGRWRHRPLHTLGAINKADPEMPSAVSAPGVVSQVHGLGLCDALSACPLNRTRKSKQHHSIQGLRDTSFHVLRPVPDRTSRHDSRSRKCDPSTPPFMESDGGRIAKCDHIDDSSASPRPFAGKQMSRQPLSAYPLRGTVLLPSDAE